jgi:cysteinyl-tRNA synthetase
VRKKNRADFALWKFYEGDPSWETELGRGRPGWHIEDTAITEKFFGPQYDIHGGAVDLKFPHHEAEIAQQESASGKSPFVKIWMHTGFLLVNGEKMSKSLKNFITIRDFLKSYPADVLRWLVLSAHYRSPLNFSWELAAQAASSFQTVEDFLGKLDFVRRVGKSSVARRDLAVLLRESRDFFEAALADDFNTPAALAQIFGLATKFQKDLWGIKPTDAKKIYEHVVALIKKLGINIKNSLPPAKVSDLVEKRELLRSNKQFIEADALRRRIKQLGYEIEDTPLGPWLKPVSNFHPKI